MNSTSRSFARPGENPAGRHLDWDGCFNVRDLGGIPIAAGGETRRGAVVRADCIDGLSAAGWSALEAHGVRTIIDLRNDDERALDASRRPDGIATLHLPLDAIDDSGFWDDWMHGPQFATPLYYAAHLARFPERSARVLAAVARAEPGGVLIHCVSGRDRTGQVSMLLLALCRGRAGADRRGLHAERCAAPVSLRVAWRAGPGSGARRVPHGPRDLGRGADRLDACVGRPRGDAAPAAASRAPMSALCAERLAG